MNKSELKKNAFLRSIVFGCSIAMDMDQNFDTSIHNQEKTTEFVNNYLKDYELNEEETRFLVKHLCENLL